MLKHLEIENYRLFNQLKIDGLKQVNLITGKNNTGKSALLEAIRIYQTQLEDVGNIFNVFIKERSKSIKTINEGFLSLLNRDIYLDEKYFKINDIYYTLEYNQIILSDSLGDSVSISGKTAFDK
jgi:AAA15 family ATPase/GTPase